MPLFKHEFRNWTDYRNLPRLKEVDFHWPDQGEYHECRESMGLVETRALDAIKSAYESGDTDYVLFAHGWSTSQRGRTTARSQVRGLMRSKEATPYIDRKRCIQHHSVFVAAVRSPG